jgi:serine/threonine protein kinase
MAFEELQNGRYHRLRTLGSGGMGEVHLMDDSRISRQVAIKVTRSESEPYPDGDTAKDAARLFQREARAIAALEHPSILPLYDFGEETVDGTTITYMVMPYCTDGSLAGWLRQRGNSPLLPPRDVAHLIEEAAEALQYAHDHQVIHLDVKSSNFLLRANSKNPNRPRLLLADFGISRNSATAASSSRTIRGTPTAMAPEQWTSQPVAASDQYALAVMAYELLTGRPPFVGTMEQLMYQHFTVAPPPPSKLNPQLSPAIDAVILRALAKDPADRYPSISDFGSAFAQAALTASTEPAQGSQPLDDGDIQATLRISLDEARAGTNRSITLPSGQHVTVAVPAGTSDGQVIRLRDVDTSSSLKQTVILTVAVTGAESNPTPARDISSAATVYTPPKIEPPVSSFSGHDLPTVAGSEPNLRSTGSKLEVPPPTKRAAARGRIIGIISGVILLLLIAGSVLFYSNYHAQQSALMLAQTSTAQAKPSPTQAPTLTPTSAPQKGLYIAGTYNGSMTNQNTGQTYTITVFLVQTQGLAPLTGSVTFKSPTQAIYNLIKGTVDSHGNFSFQVQQPAGQEPLVFQGSFQTGNFLKGNFCNSQTNTCLSNEGYFTVGPRY